MTAPVQEGSGLGLSKKMYGIPTWGWLAGAATLGAVVLIWRQSRAKAAAVASTNTTGTNPTVIAAGGNDQSGAVSALAAQQRDLQTAQGQLNTTVTDLGTQVSGLTTAEQGVQTQIQSLIDQIKALQGPGSNPNPNPGTTNPPPGTGAPAGTAFWENSPQDITRADGTKGKRFRWNPVDGANDYRVTFNGWPADVQSPTTWADWFNAPAHGVVTVTPMNGYTPGPTATMSF